jgi:very-short-patch-repair endonuclease
MPVKNIISGQRVTKEKQQRAKELRREMTLIGKLLQQKIRTNKLGVRFRRQQVIQGFIVDFYCHRAGLVVEVDGDVHDLQNEEDERWEKVLSALGLRVVRFKNDEVMRDVSAVVGKSRNLSRNEKSDSLRVALCFQLSAFLRIKLTDLVFVQRYRVMSLR